MNPTAAVLVIGNEILSGRTKDANLGHIAEALSGIGVRLREARVVADVEEEIVAAVNALRARYTYVFTTGGIGPTHDDITSACVAKAFGVALERNPEAVARLERHYGSAHHLNEARLRMANIPAGGILIDNPKRKLAHTLELVEPAAAWGEGMVGVNTGHPNALVAAAIAAGTIPELAGYARLRREVKYGKNSRIDVLLEDDSRPPAYVEIKNVHLRRPSRGDGLAAEFPDCVTARGAKHLEEMAAMVAQGHRAVMLYLVQRTDCTHFRTAADLDPAYDSGLRRALESGVEALCWSCAITAESIELDRPLPLRL